MSDGYVWGIIMLSHILALCNITNVFLSIKTFSIICVVFLNFLEDYILYIIFISSIFITSNSISGAVYDLIVE